MGWEWRTLLAQAVQDPYRARPYRVEQSHCVSDAAFLLAVGSFLLTVKLFTYS